MRLVKQQATAGAGFVLCLQSVMHFRSQLAASVPLEALDVKGKSGSTARLAGRGPLLFL